MLLGVLKEIITKIGHSVPRVVLTFKISNLDEIYSFRTLMAREIMWYFHFFPKAVATKFTNVHDPNLKHISLISIVIFRFLKKSLEVATALEKNEYTT